MFYPIAINAFHLLVVAPFLVYLAVEGPRGNVPNGVYFSLYFVAAIIALYHGYLLSQRVLK